MAGSPDGLQVLSFATAEAWRNWLAENHEEPGAWLKLAKKGAGPNPIPYTDVLDAALCFGWIDGQARSFDERYWLKRFTPRRPTSRWSKVNRERALVLIEAGDMEPAGLRQVELAQADGRWDAAYDPQSASTVPDDLQRELDRNPAAAQFFATLDSRNRYAVLHRLQTAKKPETRARRIATFVEMLAAGRKLHE